MGKDFISDENNDLSYGYNENKIVVMPKDPETIFLYWDFLNKTLEYIIENNFQIAIRFFTPDKRHFSYLYPSYTNRDWYYSIKYTDIFRQKLVAELGFYNQFGEFVVICSSQKTNLIDFSEKLNNKIVSSQELI